METETDLLGRIARFVSDGDPRLFMAGCFVGLTLVLLAAFNKRMTLIFLNLLALVFCDVPHDGIASGATLARWGIVCLITVVNLWGSASPGLPVLLLAGYGIVTIISSPFAFTPIFSLEGGLLMLLTTLGFGAALAERLRTFDDVLMLLKTILIAAGAWASVSMLFLPELVAGTRFTGAMTSGPLFSITGGLFLPIVMWGAFDAESPGWRWYSRCLSLCILVLLALSGQRTGTIAGVLGCAPMLLRRRGAVVRTVLMIAVLLTVACFLVMHLFPYQTAYVLSRYESGGFTGREGRWMLALHACISSPLIPHGLSSSDDLVGIGFHNAFLVAWFEGGLAGLALYLGAFGLMLTRGIQLMFCSEHPRVIAVSRASACVIFALVLSAFAESKLVSPSNILITMSVICGTLMHRLNLRSTSPPVTTNARWPAPMILGAPALPVRS